MNCKKCGNLLEENDQFCKNCGAPVNEISAQTNYGPAPKNSTMKFVIIFLGVAIIVAAIIISVAIFMGDKEEDDDVKTSKKKKQEVTTVEDEEEYGDEYNYDYDYNYNQYDNEEDNVVAPGITSTYSVKHQGFTFKIPTKLMYETTYSNGEHIIMIMDESENWIQTITVVQSNFDNVVKNKTVVQSNLTTQGYTVGAPIEKNIGGLDFLLFEASSKGKNGLIAYTKANPMYSFATIVITAENEFDYNVLQDLAEILKTAEYTGETANMKVDKPINQNSVLNID